MRSNTYIDSKRMDLNMKVISALEMRMAEGDLSTLMERYMMEIGNMIKRMGTGCTFTKMVQPMRECGSTISSKVKGRRSGLMEGVLFI